MDEATDVGPLVNEPTRTKVAELVESLGARYPGRVAVGLDHRGAADLLDGRPHAWRNGLEGNADSCGGRDGH